MLRPETADRRRPVCQSARGVQICAKDAKPLQLRRNCRLHHVRHCQRRAPDHRQRAGLPGAALKAGGNPIAVRFSRPGPGVKFQQVHTAKPARFRVHALHSRFMAVAPVGIRAANAPDLY